MRAGMVAGTVGTEDVRGMVMLNGESYLSSRIVWELHNGDIPDGFLVDHRDGKLLNNAIGNLRLTLHQGNMQNMKMPITNTSGVTGVSYHSKCRAWLATWREDGRQRKKQFSINKYGERRAFELACEYREQMIKELNGSGEEYTERHGKS